MPVEPGTYRIVNLKSDTAMTENHLGATVGWRRQDTKNQQWFVQQSGKGYRFKNVASGGYLALASTTDSDNKIYCSEFPTTWALMPNPDHRGHGIFCIMMGDTDRILDLLCWGGTADGTQIAGLSRAKHGNAPTQNLTWKFERISDETGGSPASTQPPAANHCADEIIKSQAAEIDFLRELVLDSRREVSRLLFQLERVQVLYESSAPNNTA